MQIKIQNTGGGTKMLVSLLRCPRCSEKPSTLARRFIHHSTNGKSANPAASAPEMPHPLRNKSICFRARGTRAVQVHTEICSQKNSDTKTVFDTSQCRVQSERFGAKSVAAQVRYGAMSPVSFVTIMCVEFDEQRTSAIVSRPPSATQNQGCSRWAQT
jgi:hypothetical protein